MSWLKKAVFDAMRPLLLAPRQAQQPRQVEFDDQSRLRLDCGYIRMIFESESAGATAIKLGGEVPVDDTARAVLLDFRPACELWRLPCGRVIPGESPVAAATRETWEGNCADSCRLTPESAKLRLLA